MLARHVGALLATACLVAVVQAAGARKGGAQDGPLVTGIHHVHLNVVDPDLAIAFYTGTFESTQETAVAGWNSLDLVGDYQRIAARGVEFFRVPAGDGGAPKNCRVPFGPRRDPGNQIHQPNARVRVEDIILFIYPDQRPERPLVSPRGRLLDHVALACRDLRATLAHLRSRGVTVLEDPYRFGNSALQAAMIEGPDRLAIELVETGAGPE